MVIQLEFGPRSADSEANVLSCNMVLGLAGDQDRYPYGACAGVTFKEPDSGL